MVHSFESEWQLGVDFSTGLVDDRVGHEHLRADVDGAEIAAERVVLATGVPLGNWQQRKEGGIGDAIALSPVVLLPPRGWLYARCDERFEVMLNHGAVEEVEKLLDRNLDPDLPVMRAIGVREIAGWLNGDWTREEALAKGQQATRNYAERQYT